MRKKSLQTLAAVALGVALGGQAYAQMGHGSMQGMDTKGAMQGGQGAGSMDMSAMGKEIHQSTVDGYKLTYRLVSMKELAAMTGTPSTPMPGQDMSQMKSHHLMVSVAGPDGKPVDGAKIGFMVTGPGGSDQKVMAEGMTGGYGALVDFKTAGSYKVKTKAVVGKKTLMDEFPYAVK